MSENVREKVFQLVAARDHAYRTPFWDEESQQYAYEDTDRIIALVEQDVARRLLSDDAVEAFNDAATFNYYGKREDHIDELRGGMATALAAIGISTEVGQ